MKESKCKNYEYDSGNVIYKGEHWNTSPADGDPYWEVTKFTYSGSDVIKIQIVSGEQINWTNRATYF